MAFSELGTYNAQPRTQRKPVAGPYRSQSSVPSIRRQATPREHRSLPYNPFNHVDHVVSGPSPLEQAVHAVASAPPPPHVSPPPIRHLLNPTGTLDPYTAYSVAGFHGAMPSPATTRSLNWNSEGRKMLHAIRQEAFRYIQGHEGLKEDPLAEFAIGTLATAGLGAGINALKGGAEGAVAASEAASAASQGSKAVRAAEALRSAPTALKGLAESLTTSTGQKALARAAAERGAAQAVAHPILTKGAMLSAAHEAGVGGGFTGVPAALLRGHLQALAHPVSTLEATGRGLAGAVAFPLGLGYELTQGPHATGQYLSDAAQGLGQIGGNLLSGDPKTVQKAVENEVGLSFLLPVPAITRLERYQRLRSGLRDAAQQARERLATEYGLPLRHGPGEQRVFGFTERRAQRKDVAKMTADTTLPSRVQTGHYERPIVAAARKTPRARSLRNLHGMEGGDLAQTLASYGFTQKGWRHHLELLKRQGPVGEPARAGDVNLRSVVDFAERNPHILEDPALWQLVEHYRHSTRNLPAEVSGKGSKRAAVLEQGQLFGIRPPEERVPHAARQFTDAQDRAGAWRDLRQSEKRAKELRTEARLKLAEAGAHEVLPGHSGRYSGFAGHQGPPEGPRLQGHAPTPEQLKELSAAKALEDRGLVAPSPARLNATRLRDEAKQLYVEARKLDLRNRDFRRALHPFSRPGAAVSSRARRKLWDQALEDEYHREVTARAAMEGMVPGVYTHHAPLRQEGEIAPQARFGNAATRVQHVRRSDEFSLAATDTVDRSLRTLLAGSVEGPRVRAAGQQLARRFFSKYSTPLKIGDQTKRRVTQSQFAQAIRDGQLSEEHYVWVPEAQYKQAYIDPHVPPERYAAEAHAALRGEIINPKTGKPFDTKGAKGVVVPKEAYKEYAAQINPVRGVADRVANAISKTAGRVLLFSPAWVASQIVAEGLPIIMSNPRLLNPAYMLKLERRLKEWNDVSPNEAMAFAATMGEAPIRAASPSELRPFQSSKAHQLFYDGARAIEHNPIGRAVFSTARLRPFVLFDQWRHGKYQKVLAAAEVDRRLNGFLSNLQGALIHEKRLSDELRHLPPGEQLHALMQPRFKRDLDKIQNYVEGITGNWTAYTRFERAFSPAAVFYGFVRYAMRWPLTFAKHHPVAATINYFLAQQNANQVEKLLGGKPTEFYQYANPVVTSGSGEKQWLPGGARVAPGLSAPAQGVLSGNAPAAAVGTLNPLYGALVGLVTGTDSFGGHDENEGALGLHWSLGARMLMSTPPLARFLGIGESHSPTAEALHRLDPNRKVRSLVDPYLSQSGQQAKESAEIIRALEHEHEAGSSGGSTSANPFDAIDSASSAANPFDNIKIP